MARLHLLLVFGGMVVFTPYTNAFPPLRSREYLLIKLSSSGRARSLGGGGGGGGGRGNYTVSNHGLAGGQQQNGKGICLYNFSKRFNTAFVLFNEHL